MELVTPHQQGKDLTKNIPLFSDLGFMLFHPEVQSIFDRYETYEEAFILVRCIQYARNLQRNNPKMSNFEILASLKHSITKNIPFRLELLGLKQQHITEKLQYT